MLWSKDKKFWYLEDPIFIKVSEPSYMKSGSFTCSLFRSIISFYSSFLVDFCFLFFFIALQIKSASIISSSFSSSPDIAISGSSSFWSFFSFNSWSYGRYLSSSILSSCFSTSSKVNFDLVSLLERVEICSLIGIGSSGFSFCSSSLSLIFLSNSSFSVTLSMWSAVLTTVTGSSGSVNSSSYEYLPLWGVCGESWPLLISESLFS